MAVGKVGALAGILECDQEWLEGHNYGRGDDRHSMPFIGEAEDELSILRSIDRGPGASGQKGVTMSDQRGGRGGKKLPAVVCLI